MRRNPLMSVALAPLARGQLPALAGLLPPLVWQLTQQGPELLARIALIGLVILGWQMLFARIRRQGFGLEGATAALLIALLVPPAAPAWQLVLGTSFGIVIGLLIFGGHGRNLLHPSIVTLSFLMFSFTGEPYRQSPDLPLWTAALAALALIGTGQANLRILLAAAAALAGFAWATGTAAPLDLLGSGLFWLLALYFAADPVASAATNWGRLVHGLLFGLLAALFLTAGSTLSALVFAALMAAIFAPAIDHAVVALNAARRARRHG